MTYASPNDARVVALAAADAHDHRLTLASDHHSAMCLACQGTVLWTLRDDGRWELHGDLLTTMCGRMRSGRHRVLLQVEGVERPHAGELQHRWREAQRRRRLRIYGNTVYGGHRRGPSQLPVVHQVIHTLAPPVPGTIALLFFQHATAVRGCR